MTFFCEFQVPFFASLLAVISLLGLSLVPDELIGAGDDFFWLLEVILLLVFLIPLMICIAFCWWGFRYLLFHWNFYCSITIFLVFNLILLFFFKAIFLYKMAFISSEAEILSLRIFYGLMWPATIAFLIALLIHLALNETPLTEKPVDPPTK
ncbi:MAG: hypothetical protein FWC50_00175 [Planctomycetaceae bacterium]|nr:hypothetical protein [Planctomycetaceae bacterium]